MVVNLGGWGFGVAVEGGEVPLQQGAVDGGRDECVAPVDPRHCRHHALVPRARGGATIVHSAAAAATTAQTR